MTNERIPVAVVGAGNMGANHVRVYDELPEADLVEVVEPDPERAAEVRENYDVRMLDSTSELEQAQAATIAVPNVQHRETAQSLIERGFDVLVEKPLAPTMDDAEAIVDTAAEHEAILQVGHIERFNPAVEVLNEILEGEQIVSMESHRLGPFNEHLSDTDVVFDLMIHDLDVIDSFLDGELDTVLAVGAKPRSSNTDHASVLLKYDSGETANLTASHVTHGKVRELSVTTIDAYVTLKYQEQRITIQRRGLGTTTPMLEQSGYRTETATESPFVQTREPLKNELEHFLGCVRERSTPRVDGEQGVNAVELSEAIVEQVRDD